MRENRTGGGLANRSLLLIEATTRWCAPAFVVVCALVLSALCLTPATAAAGELREAVSYVDADGVAGEAADVQVVSKSDESWSAGWHVAKGEVTLPRRISATGDVHLILADDAKLDVVGGIEVLKGAHLHIYGQQNQSGALNAVIENVEERHCGIGGSSGKNGGDITINGGVVTAKSGNYAAAIGGSPDSLSGTITINGGIVKATAGEAAAIGGGYNGGSGPIVIAGGRVYAKTGNWTHAAIGASHQGAWSHGEPNGDITLTGGAVFCNHGIGAGHDGKQTKVVIDGAFVQTDGSLISGDNTEIECRSGVVNGEMHGSCTLPIDYSVESKEFIIPTGSTLTVADGVTLTNKGTIKNYGTIQGAVDNKGTFLNYGTVGGPIANTGKIYTMTDLPAETRGEIVRGPSIEVTNGYVTVDGKEVTGETTVKAGSQVKVTCDATSGSKLFMGWSVVLGWDALKGVDLASRTISFAMPEDFLVLEPRYADVVATLALKDGSIRSYDNASRAMFDWEDHPDSTLTILKADRMIDLMCAPEGGVLDLGGNAVETYWSLSDAPDNLTIRNGELAFPSGFDIPENLDLRCRNVVFKPVREGDEGITITVEGRIIDEGGLIIDPRIKLQGGNKDVVDGVMPEISGVEDGKTYDASVTVTVSDGNLASVTLNGEAVSLSGSPLSAKIELSPGEREATYTVVATDATGNVSTVTFVMKAAGPVEPDDEDDGEGGSGGSGGQDGSDHGGAGGGSETGQGESGSHGSDPSDSGAHGGGDSAEATQGGASNGSPSNTLPETGDISFVGAPALLGALMLMLGCALARSRRRSAV